MDNSPLVRTDFDDEDAWIALIRASISESPDGFRADLRIIDDRRFEGQTVEDLVAAGDGWDEAAVLFVADGQALSNPEWPIICVDLVGELGRSFRCIASELWGVENNLRIANMGFDDFAGAVDPDQVFRGF